MESWTSVATCHFSYSCDKVSSASSEQFRRACAWDNSHRGPSNPFRGDWCTDNAVCATVLLPPTRCPRSSPLVQHVGFRRPPRPPTIAPEAETGILHGRSHTSEHSHTYVTSFPVRPGETIPASESTEAPHSRRESQSDEHHARAGGAHDDTRCSVPPLAGRETIFDQEHAEDNAQAQRSRRRRRIADSQQAI
ncbi:hypothetical protein BV20DRAFT_475416 [Pilatotrama ljubarskyi]|nr:hypothetical protein BV20DRAFT_475416 [Pilatotrama ljubarskyi]